MGRSFLLILAAMTGAMTMPLTAQPDSEFIVIAHRGASGERPEHTLAAYELAIDQGADYIEPDLVVTKDMVLVSRHENEIGQTTDVETREEFADRRRTKTIDGRRVAGWFVEDFTLAELRTLRAKERIPAIRPQNARYNGLYQVPTLEEVVMLVRAKEAETGRRIGLYPELKHPTFFLQSEGIDIVDLLQVTLKQLGITPDDPIYIQSFETSALGRLNSRTDFKLIQLVRADGGPFDEPGLTYAEMVSPSGMAELATYVDGVGAEIPLILQPDGSPTTFVADAHKAGLKVHAWTLRKENAFLPPQLQIGSSQSMTGCDSSLFRMLRDAGADGVFSDDPGRAAEYRDTGGMRACPIRPVAE